MQVALKNKVNMKDCLSYIKSARAKGLTAPVILMGYLNPFLAYGLDDLMKDAQEAGKIERQGMAMASRPCVILQFCLSNPIQYGSTSNTSYITST